MSDEVRMKRVAGLAMAVITLLGIAWVAIPVVLIRPFGAQTPRGLALSYTLRSTSPLLTPVLFVAGFGITLLMWRRLASRMGRALAVLALGVLGGSAFLARLNHFEWMFRPLPRPEFSEAASVKGIAEDDLVLGVQLRTEARAYPVLALAYHHIVNDTLAGEPIVATY